MKRTSGKDLSASTAANLHSGWAPSKSQRVDGQEFQNVFLTDPPAPGGGGIKQRQSTLYNSDTAQHLYSSGENGAGDPLDERMDRLEEQVLLMEEDHDERMKDEEELTCCLSWTTIFMLAGILIFILSMTFCLAGCVNAVMGDTHVQGNVVGNYQMENGQYIPNTNCCCIYDCGCPRACWLTPTLIVLIGGCAYLCMRFVCECSWIGGTGNCCFNGCSWFGCDCYGTSTSSTT